MSSVSAELSPQSARLRALVFPREHGAWGILLVPLATGGLIGLARGTHLLSLGLFVLGATALFLLRTPVESLLATTPFRPQNESERRAVLRAASLYALVGVFSFAVLITMERAFDLLLLGAAVAVVFLAQAALKKLGRETRMSAQLIGSIGLTATAAAAYYVVTGRLGATAATLWAANWLFAVNQIHFVQVCIHAGRMPARERKWQVGRVFLAGQLLTISLLVFAWRAELLPPLAVAAFVPILARGFVWLATDSRQPLVIQKVGVRELIHAILFGVLLILGFLVGR